MVTEQRGNTNDEHESRLDFSTPPCSSYQQRKYQNYRDNGSSMHWTSSMASMSGVECLAGRLTETSLLLSLQPKAMSTLRTDITRLLGYESNLLCANLSVAQAPLSGTIQPNCARSMAGASVEVHSPAKFLSGGFGFFAPSPGEVQCLPPMEEIS